MHFYIFLTYVYAPLSSLNNNILMNSSMLEDCDICKTPYDKYQHSPMIMCSQQHICCEYCISQIFLQQIPKCPECRKVLKKEEIHKFRQYLDWLKQSKETRTKLKKTQEKVSHHSQITSAIQKIISFQFTNQYQFFRHTKQAAESLFEEGKNYAAIGLLKALIQRFPKQREYTFIGLGSKEQQSGFSEGKALSWYKGRYGVKELSAEDLLNHMLMETPQYECFDWLFQLVQKHPQNYKLIYSLALNEHNRNNYQDALKYYKIVIDLNPQFSKAYCMAAFLIEDQQQILRLANICLAKDPTNIFAKYLIASSQNIDQLAKFCQQQPFYVQALNKYGEKLRDQSQHEQAISKYQACLERNSLFSKPKINILWTFYNQGLFSKALEYSAKFLKQDLDTNIRSQIFSLIGAVYYQQKQLKQSLYYFKQSIKSNPQNRATIIDLACLYLEQEKYDFAAKLFQQALSKDENNLDALRGITNSLMCMGKVNQSFIYYYKWLKADPQNITIQFCLGNAYLKVENWEKSLNCYLQCKAKSFELKPTYLYIIQIYCALADYKNAFKNIGQFLQLNDISDKQYKNVIYLTNIISQFPIFSEAADQDDD